MTVQGEAFTVEFLIDDPVSLPHHNAFIRNLGILGIEADFRIVDAVQYRKRVDAFDFETCSMVWVFEHARGCVENVFYLASRRDEGITKCGWNIGSGHRCACRACDCSRKQAGTGGRV